MKMPTKIPAEIDMSDEEDEMMPEQMEMAPQPKQYLWAADLKGKDYQMKFEGGDSEDEQLIFKSAALGAGAKGKHVVELSAVDVKSEKVTVVLCVLTDDKCYVRLPEISVEPPILLKLTEGEGPVNICANHIVTEESEFEDEESEDEEMEEEGEEAGVDDRKEEKVEDLDMIKEEKIKKEATGKRKADDSPEKAAETKKAKAEKPKKAPKTYATIDELKKAILANPGGKPKKEEKFKNWVKNTMKCSKDEWFADLWSWHNEQTKA